MASPPRSNNDVPSHVILDFFQTATKALETTTYPNKGPEEPISDVNVSLHDLRQHLLTVQKECLRRVVEEYNNHIQQEGITVEDVQETLATIVAVPAANDDDDDRTTTTVTSREELHHAMETLNETARIHFCRLVLYGEWIIVQQQKNNDDVSSSRSCRHHRQENNLTDDSALSTSNLLEFCGLCQVAVKLPNVQEYLARGTPLFHAENHHHLAKQQHPATSSNPTKHDSPKVTMTTKFPSDRMEQIQRMFLQALGYDADFGTKELQRVVMEQQKKRASSCCDDDMDDKVVRAWQHMTIAVQGALTHATATATRDGMKSNDDGVTRIVSVKYSEKLVDAETGEELLDGEGSGAAPQSEHMTEEENRSGTVTGTSSTSKQQWQLAREASAIQQEILDELLSMCDDERTKKLQSAKDTEQRVLQRAMELPPGPERVSYFLSLDTDTQRDMAMTKLWEGMMLASHDGQQPPTTTMR